MSADNGSTLNQVWSKVQEAARNEVESYSPNRYPYTYAADFLRAHTHLLPEDVFEVVKPVSSRADASRARHAWAAHLGVKNVELAVILADGYLIEHGISPGVANLERGKAVLSAMGIQEGGES